MPKLSFVIAAVAALAFSASSHAETSLYYVTQSANGSVAINSASNVVIVNGKVISGGNGNVIAGKGAAKEIVRDLAVFTGIRIDAGVQVEFIPSDKPSIKLIAQENILPLVTTIVSEGKLQIGVKSSFSTSTPIKAILSGPSPTSLKINGSGSFNATKLSSSSLEIKVSGSGNVAAAGTVDVVRVDISGSGNVDTSGIKAKSVAIDISGSGHVQAFASQSADVDLSGSGAVRIAGSPSKRSSDKTGSGSIKFD